MRIKKKDFKLLYVFIFFLLFSKCAFLRQVMISSDENEIGSGPSFLAKYKLSDKGGDFSFIRESGLEKKHKKYIVKRQIFPLGSADSSKILEKSISIAKIEKMNEKKILIPEISQFNVWFESEKYFSQSKVNWSKRVLELSLTSPEKQWNGITVHPFPADLKVLCYFSQVIECAHALGFIKKAIKFHRGEMKFHFVMEGHPYIREQYLNLPEEIFHSAKLTYSGRNKGGERQFTLDFGNQSIFYFLSEKSLKISKIFWVSQGLSITKI